jgi:hypothetical protein
MCCIFLCDLGGIEFGGFGVVIRTESGYFLGGIFSSNNLVVME